MWLRNQMTSVFPLGTMHATLNTSTIMDVPNWTQFNTPVPWTGITFSVCDIYNQQNVPLPHILHFRLIFGSKNENESCESDQNWIICPI